MFDQLDHIAIISSDYRRAKHFYHDILGFSIIRDVQRMEKRDRLLMLQNQRGTIKLEIFIKEKSPARLSYPEAAGLRHIAFKVKNLESLLQRLEEAGVKIENIREDDFNHAKMVFIFDPDNLPIELHE